MLTPLTQTAIAILRDISQGGNESYTSSKMRSLPEYFSLLAKLEAGGLIRLREKPGDELLDSGSSLISGHSRSCHPQPEGEFPDSGLSGHGSSVPEFTVQDPATRESGVQESTGHAPAVQELSARDSSCQELSRYELTRPSYKISLLNILEATGEHLNCNHPTYEEMYMHCRNAANKLGIINHMTRLYLSEIPLTDL